MLTTTIRPTYDHAGEQRPVPGDVMARVQDAARLLEEELKPIENFEIAANWSCAMPQHGQWEVLLHLQSEGGQYEHRFPLTDLILPTELRQNVRWAVFDFARAMSRSIRKDLQRIQLELKQLVAEGKE